MKATTTMAHGNTKDETVRGVKSVLMGHALESWALIVNAPIQLGEAE